MKKIFSLFLLLTAAFCFAEADFRQLPYEEKIKDKGLTFALTFDRMSTNADFSKGNPLSSLHKLPLGLRNLTGIDSKNAFSPEGGERLFFFAHRNCDIAKGTAIIWVRCDYPIANCGNAGILHIKWPMNTEIPTETSITAYLYKGRAYTCWSSSVPPVGFGLRYRHVQKGAAIKARTGEWFQLAVTWDEKFLKIYIDGELGDSISMLAKYGKVMATGYDKDTSTMGFKTPLNGDKNAVRTVIDDIKVFDRVLSDAEIKQRFTALVKNKKRLPSVADIRLSGVEKSPYTMEADITLVAIPGSKAKTASAVLTGPGGFKQQKTLPAVGQKMLLFDGVKKEGKYKLTLTVDPKTSAPVTASAEIDVPDLSFVGFKGGDDDSIPTPFVKPVIDCGKKSFKVFKKTLYFGNTPYPRSVILDGKELLRSAPELKIPGKKIKWGKAVMKADGKGRAVLTGSGKLDKGAVDFKTTIDFDGMCHTVLTLRGIKKLPGLSLDWQVSPEFCDTLQRPRLVKSGRVSGPWPLALWTDPYLLWLASEKGGWSWMPDSDANWRFKEGEHIFFADRFTGKCQVKMVTSPTVVPADKIDINTGIFLATPTRPLVAKRRGLRYGGHPLEGGFDETMGHIALWGGFRMHKQYFESLFPAATGVSAKKLENTKGYHCIYYGMTSPAGAEFVTYYKKYVHYPSGYTYTSNHLRDPRNDKILARADKYPQIPCRMTSELYHDYVMWHLNKLLKHRYVEKIRMVYDDLCGVHQASSVYDFVKDAYGRTIKPFDTLSVRKFLFRQLRLCHDAGIPFMLHGQNAFVPAVHSLADYWLPGEHFEPEVRRTQDPYFYSRNVKEDVARCELNTHLLGVSIMFLPAGISYRSRPGRKFNADAYVNSLAAALLPYDIEFKGDKWFWNSAFRFGFKKIWDIMEKGGVFKEDIVAYRSFEKKPVSSSNADVRLAAYDIRDGRWFLVLGNVTEKAQKTRIDISKLLKKSFVLPELYAGGNVQVKDGVFEITVPAHTIRLFSLSVK